MTQSIVSKIQPMMLRDLVVEEIRQAILQSRLKPGDRIREREISEQLGVSRIPVREAFLLLEREGLLDRFPNRGVAVHEFDEKDIREIFYVRLALENFAAELVIDNLIDEDFAQMEAALQKDGEFHRYLIERTGNSHLLNLWKTIQVQYTASFNYRNPDHSKQYQDNMDADHQLILEALRSRDIAQVQKANREIIDRVIAQCIEGLALHKAKMPTKK